MNTFVKLLLAAALVYGGYQFLGRREAMAVVYSTNAAEDIRKAVAEAGAAHKRILVDVGSKGCVWCVRLHNFIEADPELRELAGRYVTVRADLKANIVLLNAYGQVPGTPHFFILAEDGQLLSSQDTEVMEAGDSYDREKMTAFFKRWLPGADLRDTVGGYRVEEIGKNYAKFIDPRGNAVTQEVDPG